MTVFVIQESTMEDSFSYACLVANSYKDVIYLKFLPFVNVYVFNTFQDIDVLLNADHVVCNSGIEMLVDVVLYEQITCMVGEKMQHVDAYTTWLIKRKLRQGYFYDSYEFDQISLSLCPTIKPYMLNQPTSSVSYQQAMKLAPFVAPTFVKPSTDLKWFNASVVNAGVSFKDNITSQIHSDVLDNPRFDCGVLLSKPIQGISDMLEYRCFIVDGQYVTGSFYGQARKRVKPTSKHALYLQSWAQSIAEKICHINTGRKIKTFVVDLILIDEFDMPPSIVEINCLNCSGLYQSDGAKLVQALRNLG